MVCPEHQYVDIECLFSTRLDDFTGNYTNKTSSVLTMALPVLMKAMQRNASTPQGAEGLMGAIQGKHDGSILDNLGGLFGGGVMRK